MHVIHANNINDAWQFAKVLLNSDHIIRPSRVGEVMECTMPVTTVYHKPCERVLFDPERNANPFFQFMEALHLLAGRNDVAWLERFNSKIRDFVGKADAQHAAYGHRLRVAFDMDGGAEDDFADQIVKVIRMLKKNPDERRAVLTMWNPLWDLERPEIPDVPCNMILTLKIRNGKLDMIVFCRSNDIAFGCYGSNVVQFSFLLEYLAGMIGVPVGRYWQVSDSWHAYTARWEALGGFLISPLPLNYYDGVRHTYPVTPYPLIADPESFDKELQLWINRRWKTTFNNPFFYVAEQLWYAWDQYKLNNFDNAFSALQNCKATDWRKACEEWLVRVQQKRSNKASV